MQRYQEIEKALGSRVMLTILLPDERELSHIFTNLWQMIHAFEDRFSRFKETSELAHFNNRAGRLTDVSPEFFDLLSTSRRMHATTGGLFNPFVLPALQLAGYVGSWPKVTDFSESLNYQDRSLANGSSIELESSSAKIPENTAIDFGGIGKGYLLDKLGEYLHAQNIKNFWLSLGGDILWSGHDLDDKLWSVGVQNAFDASALSGSIICDTGTMGGIATSGIIKRKGTHKSQAWHHLIDPRSGKPANTDILTATMTAPTATEADVYAKAAVLLGSDDISLLQGKFDGSLHAQLRTGKTIQCTYRKDFR